MTLTPTTRASLLLRLGNAHDHEAWLEFVTLYEPVIYRLLRQRGLQDADARDVMQELLLGGQSEHRTLAARSRASILPELAATGNTQSRHQLAQKSPTPRSWLVVQTCTLCWIRCRPRIARIRANSTVNYAEPGFSRPANGCKRKSSRATWQAFWETSVLALAGRGCRETRDVDWSRAGGQMPRSGPHEGDRSPNWRR